MLWRGEPPGFVRGCTLYAVEFCIGRYPLVRVGWAGFQDLLAALAQRVRVVRDYALERFQQRGVGEVQAFCARGVRKKGGGC